MSDHQKLEKITIWLAPMEAAAIVNALRQTKREYLAEFFEATVTDQRQIETAKAARAAPVA